MPPDDTSMFTPLALNDTLVGYDASFNATGSIGDTTVTTAAPPSTNPSATGAAPTAGVSGFQTVLNTLTSAFQGGVAAYNTVAANTGLPLANGQQTTATPVAVAQPTVFAGLTQNQLYLVGGGIALIAILLIMKKR